MANDNLECPVDFVTINENRTRMVAFLILLLGITCFVQLNWGVAIFLLIDFSLRTFNLNNYSPLSFLAGKLVILFNIKNKPTDRAPKRFAAMMGMVFTGVIALALLMDWITFAKIMLVLLLICAALESLAGICVGCHVYTYLKRLGLVK